MSCCWRPSLGFLHWSSHSFLKYYVFKISNFSWFTQRVSSVLWCVHTKACTQYFGNSGHDPGGISWIVCSIFFLEIFCWGNDLNVLYRLINGIQWQYLLIFCRNLPRECRHWRAWTWHTGWRLWGARRKCVIKTGFMQTALMAFLFQPAVSLN